METAREHIVYSFTRTPSEEIRFSFKEYMGRWFIDIRVWFQPKESREFYPSKRGLWVPLESLADLATGLKHLSEGLSDLENLKPAAVSPC